MERKDIFDNVNKLLQFAETKNGALLTFNGVLIVLIINKIDFFNGIKFCNLLIPLSLFFFLASLLVNLLSFFPSTKTGIGKNVIFFKSIAKKFKTTKDYSLDLDNKISSKELNNDLDEEIKINSEITNYKFNCFRFALIFNIIGLLFFIISGYFVVSNKLLIQTDKHKPENNKIGIIIPLTGNLAFMGTPEKYGFELALQNFKSEHKSSNVDLIFEDSHSSSSNAVSASEKLINIDKTKVMIVANTGPNLAIAPITEKENILHIAFCMEPDIQKKHELLFRLYESSIQEGEAIRDYLIKCGSLYKRIAFLYIDQPNFVKTVEDVIKPKLKNESIFELFFEKYKLNEVTFSPLLTKIKTKNINCLVILGYGSEYPKLFNQMKELGIRDKVDIIGGWGFLYPQMSAELLEGVKVAAPIFAISNNKISNEFRNQFLEKYNIYPNFDAAFSYSALRIVLEAIKNSISFDPNKIGLQLEGKTFQTPIGNVLIKNREIMVEMGIGKYKNGKLTFTEE